MKVRTRYAPSPTGYFHIGGARTALYNFLYAKHNHGDFIVREEDTDISRNVENGMESQLSNLTWLGLNYDESILNPGEFGPYKQTLKLEQYKKLAYKLLDENKVYRCFCSKEELDKDRKLAEANGETPKYNRRCFKLTQEQINDNLKQNKEFVLRLKVQDNIDVEWNDLVRGKISVPTSSLTDPVILKSNQIPMYNFAVVIDDYDMNITHVLRGEEHISNTPYQILIKRALGYDTKEISYGHLSIIVNDQNKKLSKRDTSLKQFIEDYKNMGYLPISVINYLLLLGWSPADNKEILNIDEMIEKFDLSRVSKAPAKVDLTKLNWIGNEHFKKLEDITYLSFIKNYITIKNDILDKHLDEVLILLKPQISYGTQIDDLIKSTFIADKEPSDDLIFNLKQYQKEINVVYEALYNQLEKIRDWTEENISSIIKELKDITGLSGKNLFMPIRILCTKKMHGPQLAKIIYFNNKQIILDNMNFIKEYVNEKI